MVQILCGITLILIALVHNGAALQCWACSSDLDPSCLDHFNTTKILQQRSLYHNINGNNQFQRNDMPTLVECSNNLGQIYGQKQICRKRVMSLPTGRQLITRECAAVSVQQQTGTCPEDPMSRGTSRVFCEYCDHDGCNAASGLTNTFLLTGFLALSTMLLVRH